MLKDMKEIPLKTKNVPTISFVQFSKRPFPVRQHVLLVYHFSCNALQVL